MPPSPKILLDPSFRRMEEIFTPQDIERLSAAADILWAKNEPAPEQFVHSVQADLSYIVTPAWRYGALSDFPQLWAIVTVGGEFPSPQTLDYKECFARGIRVLSSAPAFGPMVAEMALGMVLAASREIVAGHNAFVRGEEKYYWSGNTGTFTLYDQTVGFIGFGGQARALYSP